MSWPECKQQRVEQSFQMQGFHRRPDVRAPAVLLPLTREGVERNRMAETGGTAAVAVVGVELVVGALESLGDLFSF